MRPLDPRARRLASVREWRGMLIGALVVASVIVLVLGVVRVQEADPDVEEPISEQTPNRDDLRSEQTGTLEVPGSVALDPTTLPALEAGQKYLIELQIHAEKPEDSPGRATYFGYNLSCKLDDNSGQTISVGGTENLVNGRPVVLSAAALLPGAEDARYSCRALVANEYAGVASTGSKIPFTAEWVATPVLEDSEWVSMDDVLPVVVESGSSFELFSGQIPIQEAGGEGMLAIVNVHSTTCTTVSGSNEDGRAWCDEETLDDGGSKAEYRIHLERTGDLTSCSSDVQHVAHIDGLVHHYVASLAEELLRDPRCEGPAELQVSVLNDGPAPLVLHRQNTEILIVHLA